MALPTDSLVITVELNDAIVVERDTRFAIREGNRTVGSGIVTKMLD